jgi:hypothetical protein
VVSRFSNRFESTDLVVVDEIVWRKDAAGDYHTNGATFGSARTGNPTKATWP